MAATVRGVRIPFRPMDDDDADDGHRQKEMEKMNTFLIFSPTQVQRMQSASSSSSSAQI